MSQFKDIKYNSIGRGLNSGSFLPMVYYSNNKATHVIWRYNNG